MAVQHPALAQALGAGGDHVLAGDFVEKRILGQDGQGRETANHQGGHRQYQVPEVIGDLAQGRQRLEIVRDQAAHREPVQRGAAGEHHDQEHGEQESRHGIADDDRGAAPDIEMTAVVHGLANP
ncbi:hypothetical protein D3C81_1947930 [compost metagenome]